MAGGSSISYGLKLEGFFDPDFNPVAKVPDFRDDSVEAQELPRFYYIMGYTDGYIGNPSRPFDAIPQPWNRHYNEGYYAGNWQRTFMTTF